MRRRRKSSRTTGTAKWPTRGNQAAAALAKKSTRPPLAEQFYVAVDRQLKSGYQSYEAAERAALAIKKRYPILQVTVYDVKQQRHTTVERPSVVADPTKKSSHRMRSARSQRRVAAGGKR